MQSRPYFANAEQAVNALMPITQRLSHLVVWLIFGVVHLALLIVMLAALWWFQVTPAAVETAAIAVLSSSPVSAAQALGLSIAGAAAAYLAAAKWIWKKTAAKWLFAHILQDI